MRQADVPCKLSAHRANCQPTMRQADVPCELAAHHANCQPTMRQANVPCKLSAHHANCQPTMRAVSHRAMQTYRCNALGFCQEDFRRETFAREQPVLSGGTALATGHVFNWAWSVWRTCTGNRNLSCTVGRICAFYP
eukprot:353710-Chlamydomonas_euryale.AAC.1